MVETGDTNSNLIIYLTQLILIYHEFKSNSLIIGILLDISELNTFVFNESEKSALVCGEIIITVDNIINDINHIKIDEFQRKSSKKL